MRLHSIWTLLLIGVEWMSREKPAPIDMSGKQACQLMPNPNFLSRKDFLDDEDKLVDISAKISKITKEELQMPGSSKKELKTVLAFKNATKRLVLNKTNIVNVKSHYGEPLVDWIGKPVTLYFDPTVKFGRDTVGGVRIRKKR